MAAIYPWIQDNWFPLLQSTGILGGLVFGGTTLRRDIRARQVSDLLSLTEQHRELWSEAHRRPELARILQTEVDLVASPITAVEEEFLNVVIVHYSTGWELTRRGALLSRESLALDAKDFFTHPLPDAVWKRTKRHRNPDFVSFVESAIGRSSSMLSS